MGMAPSCPTVGETGSFSHPVVSLSFKGTCTAQSLWWMLSHTHTHQSIKSQPELFFLFFLLSQQERGHSRESVDVNHAFEENKGNETRVRTVCRCQEKIKGSGNDVSHNQTGSHRQTQRNPTVSIAVVSVCDTPETLLSSSVPDLQEQEDIFIIIIHHLPQDWAYLCEPTFLWGAKPPPPWATLSKKKKQVENHFLHSDPHTICEVTAYF